MLCQELGAALRHCLDGIAARSELYRLDPNYQLDKPTSARTVLSTRR